ncbi:MAG: hypothetical protein BWK75_00525 [Candidatus Altiarchaeales archaeon A3]|nr:MAG: hypothetical protein BWK75_00525 [Candidatus Altiarchaeales archaeon A3]
MKIIFPSEFKERYSELLGDENKIFLDYCAMPLKKCIRLNTLKVKDVSKFVENLNERYKLENVPFCDYAYFIDNLNPGKMPEYFFGEIYIQEAASLIPPLAMNLNPERDEFVFDACAAPGSKTTQIAQLMNNKGCIVANDASDERIKALFFNLESYGVLNVVVTGMDLERMRTDESISKRFDKILVDAPCSCEGTVRKDRKVLSRWGVNLINFLSVQQKKIIRNAINMLKKDGILIYSTCTLAPEENEGVIDYAIRNFDVEIERVDIKNLKTREGITEWNGNDFGRDMKKCIRIYPQDNDTEGFFVAKLRKI